MNGPTHKAHVPRLKGGSEAVGEVSQGRHGCLRAPGRKRRGAAELEVRRDCRITVLRSFNTSEGDRKPF